MSSDFFSKQLLRPHFNRVNPNARQNCASLLTDHFFVQCWMTRETSQESRLNYWKFLPNKIGRIVSYIIHSIGLYFIIDEPIRLRVRILMSQYRYLYSQWCSNEYDVDSLYRLYFNPNITHHFNNHVKNHKWNLYIPEMIQFSHIYQYTNKSMFLINTVFMS